MNKYWLKHGLLKMVFSQREVLIFIFLTCLCAGLVQSKNTCNENEFSDKKTGKCFECTVCDKKLNLVTWIPCTNESNTVCGPKWTLRTGDSTKNVIKGRVTDYAVFQAVEDCTEVKKWKTIKNVFTGILIGVGFAIVLVIATACVLQRRRRRHSLYKISYRDEKSLQEIANERMNIEENGNIYVKTEDILLKSHV